MGISVPAFLAAGLNNPMGVSESMLNSAWGAGGVVKRGLLDEIDEEKLGEVAEGFAFAGVAVVSILLVLGVFLFTVSFTRVATSGCIFAYQKRKADNRRANARRARLHDLEMNDLNHTSDSVALRNEKESPQEPPPTYQSAPDRA